MPEGKFGAPRPFVVSQLVIVVDAPMTVSKSAAEKTKRVVKSVIPEDASFDASANNSRTTLAFMTDAELDYEDIEKIREKLPDEFFLSFKAD